MHRLDADIASSLRAHDRIRERQVRVAQCAVRGAHCAVRYCRTASGRRSIPRPSRTAHVRTSYIAFLIAPSRSCFPPTPVYTTLPALSSTTTYDVAGTSHFPVASPFASQSWIPGT